MATKMKEKTVFENQKGKIISLEDSMFGGIRYILLDTDENYVRDIPNTFKVSDYL